MKVSMSNESAEPTTVIGYDGCNLIAAKVQAGGLQVEVQQVVLDQRVDADPVTAGQTANEEGGIFSCESSLRFGDACHQAAGCANREEVVGLSAHVIPRHHAQPPGFEFGGGSDAGQM